MVFQTIYQTCHDYYNDLPDDMLPTIGKSAAYSFTVSLLYRNLNIVSSTNLHEPLIAAGVASLAAVIHALTAPIFNRIFENQDLKFVQETVKFAINVIFAQTLVNQLTSYNVNLVTLNGNFFRVMNSSLIQSIFQIVKNMFRNFDTIIDNAVENFISSGKKEESQEIKEEAPSSLLDIEFNPNKLANATYFVI